MNFYRILPSLLAFLVSLPLSAQFQLVTQSGQCGTQGKAERLHDYQAGLYDHLLSESTDTFKLGITVHVVGTTSGDGYIATDRLLKAFDVLQRDFMSFNVLPFLEGEIRYIDNSVFYEHNFSQGATMMMIHNQPNTVNCYIVEDPAGNCGYYSPSRDGLVVAKNCMDVGDRTWSHELGHFLTLPHTFIGWSSSAETLPTEEAAPAMIGNREVEKVDGSNCSTAADGFCDTPPDYMSFSWSCNSAGYYPDTLIDPDGTRFAAEAGNIMSYVRDFCLPAPGDGFSIEQMDAMEIDLILRGNLGEEIDCTPAITENVSLLIPEDGANISPVDELSVLLEWTAAEHADQYLLEISPNQFFTGLVGEAIVQDTSLLLTPDLIPIQENRRYYWRVRPFSNFAFVSDYSEEFTFRIDDLLSSNLDINANNAFQVFPNPVHSKANDLLCIRANGLLTTEVARLTLTDGQGQQVWQKAVSGLANGQLNEQIAVNHLPSGLYFMGIEQAGQRGLIKVMIR